MAECRRRCLWPGPHHGWAEMYLEGPHLEQAYILTHTAVGPWLTQAWVSM